MPTKYIFVTGGVMSGVGKGVAAASIGKILQSSGFSVTAIKIDPYVNVDAGTMSPTEHGEVFVLDDGMECDQDMGNYERFLDTSLSGANYMTTGSVYLSVINKERAMEYGGKCVDVVPQIPLEVINRINNAAKKNHSDIVIIEVGGTVGEYQNILFLEAIRMLKIKRPKDVVVVLVSFIPALGAGGNELKTKPTQYAVKSLNSVGIQPDIILARAPGTLDQKRKEKIQFMCGLEEGDVVSAPNVESIYEIPVNLENDNISGRILKKLFLKPKNKDLEEWRAFVHGIQNPNGEVKIGIVGKYFGSGDFILTDSYISVLESVRHAAYAWDKKPVVEWLDSNTYEKDEKTLSELKKYDGIIVPGGFGNRGVEGKIKAIGYCRKNKIPFLGLCLGLQLSVIEFARNVAGIKDATSREFEKNPKNPVIDVMDEQKDLLKEKRYGGTMRLGAYDCQLTPGTVSQKTYDASLISERHRHRYEVNNTYLDGLMEKGLVIAGINPKSNLVEIIEIQNHPFFVATQFHPEFKSRPMKPHPLFKEFIRVAIGQK
ncbi:MAG: CTP synthase [Candidatus Staskawiczbacteria bacterium RIFOXYB1_FULL_37_44]|uniref:CTP synthase n=1 Tax=Candidatus Staskawiczbacteria bacterium RIFOXYB1_FULL_37_44 TaxID=1802223 RepID=A0A1G2IX29_9BACT|nr:MAG: CTP synthase [Candidatus Staskawiczbacteria bacterium RIFOXYB1_FULL_37_44]OGZ83688.1 MAG: CTP synthase [Candidatus Staskawiczbacteria bacterium RIFOXYC1_FULL_37_52]OGZ87197.1 MAG: CTP synthase [Candidatus Staskawiczbacteria bacterium RIFOXYC2_FULL_37_19]OGZ90212.1 MAG: CTP synthase [Candidatus Staskawiczbacteria bacterium RIFOXYD1_FULL_37_110]